MSSNFPDILISDLTIESMAYGGAGIAKKDGKVYFLDGCIEGDQVVGKITKDKKSYSKGITLEITKNSKYRRKSKCTYSDECGGCFYLEADYSQQTNWKKDFILSSLYKGTKISRDYLESIFTYYSSESEYSYRNRIRLHVECQSDQISFGYNKKNTSKIIPINSCKISDSFISKKLNSIKDRLSKLKIKQPKVFQLELQKVQKPVDGSIGLVVTVIFESKKEQNFIETLKALLLKDKETFWVGSAFEVNKSEYFLYDQQFDIKYLTKPSVFQQVNLSLNKQLRKVLKGIVEEKKINNRIIDLYCGSGNLSLHLASLVKSVTGIEFNSTSISCAKESAKINNIKNGNYIKSDCLKYISKNREILIQPDLVIADPPRQGLKPIVDGLIALKSQYLFIVGCDPMNLARDIAIIIKSGYEIEKIYGFDFFPQTYHVETAILLKKNN